MESSDFTLPSFISSNWALVRRADLHHPFFLVSQFPLLVQQTLLPKGLEPFVSTPRTRLS